MNTATRKLALFLVAILSCAHALAGTVTYRFDETGWINSAGTTENFLGRFKGIPDAQGDLSLATLTGFSATLTETNSFNQTKTIATFVENLGSGGLTVFLYDPALNSLTLSATGTPGALICLGSAVSAGDCGSLAPRPVPRPGTPPLPPIDGLFVSSVNGTLNAYTTNLPALSAVSGPVPRPTPSPEPASLSLCGGGLVLLSVFLRGCRKRCPAPRAHVAESGETVFLADRT